MLTQRVRQVIVTATTTGLLLIGCVIVDVMIGHGARAAETADCVISIISLNRYRLTTETNFPGNTYRKLPGGTLEVTTTTNRLFVTNRLTGEAVTIFRPPKRMGIGLGGGYNDARTNAPMSSAIGVPVTSVHPHSVFRTNSYNDMQIYPEHNGGSLSVETNSSICRQGESSIKPLFAVTHEFTVSFKSLTSDNRVDRESVATGSVTYNASDVTINKNPVLRPAIQVTPSNVSIQQNLRLAPTKTPLTVTLTGFAQSSVILQYSGALSIGTMKINESPLPKTTYVAIPAGESHTITDELTVTHDTPGTGMGQLTITATFY